MDLDNFLMVEEKYKLLDSQIKGHHFWIYSRAVIQWYMRSRIFEYTSMQDQSAVPFFEKTKLRFAMLKNALLHSSVKRQKCDLLVLNNGRRIWHEDHYECIYTDSIVERIPHTIVLEIPFKQMHSRPVNTPDLIYLDRIELKAQLFLYYKKYIRKSNYEQQKKEIVQKITVPLKELEILYQVPIEVDYFAELMTTEYFKHKIKIKEFDKIIKRYQPGVILEVNSGNPNCMAMNELAKINKIPTYEVQHGINGKWHVEYNYPPNTPIRQFPDHILVFSDFWKENTRYPLSSEKVISVGFPYLEREKRNYPKMEKQSGIVTILFLSQITIGKQLAQIATEVAGRLDGTRYRIIYKLHPNEYSVWKDLYPELADTAIEVIDHTKSSLYQLFSRSDIQVGFSSTSIYEGLIYHLHTFIYVYNDYPEMMQLIDSGYAKRFGSSDELADLIMSCDADQTPRNNPFWKEGALDHIVDIVSKAAGRSQTL